ncbi:hypothetical protein PP728_24190, partial [Ralstonia solanacearum]|uniref:hypothetical protein n=1 Tax=Ralstonia solanacearum TaxID=305 RepID=UPI002029BA5B
MCAVYFRVFAGFIYSRDSHRKAGNGVLFCRVLETMSVCTSLQILRAYVSCNRRESRPHVFAQTLMPAGFLESLTQVIHESSADDGGSKREERAM